MTSRSQVVRIVVADDHTLVRHGIASILAEIDGLELVGEAQDGREALEVVRKSKPDILLLDISLPQLNGLEVAERLHSELPDLGIVVISMHSNEEYVARALRVGARGYLLKSSSHDELALAIRAALAGDVYLSPAVSRPVVERFLTGSDGHDNPLDILTPRQREILQLVAEGLTSREIAEGLHLSLKTVESHRSNLMDRLDIHDLAGLVRFAIESGLVTHPTQE